MQGASSERKGDSKAAEGKEKRHMAWGKPRHGDVKVGPLSCHVNQMTSKTMVGSLKVIYALEMKMRDNVLGRIEGSQSGASTDD